MNKNRVINLPFLLISLPLIWGALSLAPLTTHTISAQERPSKNDFVKALPENNLLYVDAPGIQSLRTYFTRMEGPKKPNNVLRSVRRITEKATKVNIKPITDQVERIQFAMLEIPNPTVRVRNFLQLPPPMMMAVSCEHPDVFQQLLSGELNRWVNPYRRINSYTVYQIRWPRQTNDLSRVPLFLLIKGNTLYLTTVIKMMEFLLAPEQKDSSSSSLPETIEYQKAREHGIEQPDVFTYVNLSPLWRNITSSMKRSELRQYQKYEALLGFPEINRFSYSGRVHDGEFNGTGSFLISEYPFPLYDLIRAKPRKLQLSSWIPENVLFSAITSLPDGPETWTGLKKMFKRGMDLLATGSSESFSSRWNEMTRQFQQHMGVRLKSLIKHAGNELGWMILLPARKNEDDDLQPFSDLLNRQALILSADDSTRAQTMLETFLNQSSFLEMIKQQLESKTVKHQNTTIHTFARDEESHIKIDPTFFVKDQYLCFTTSLPVARQLLDAASSQSSIMKTEWYGEKRTRLPDRLSTIFVGQSSDKLIRESVSELDVWRDIGIRSVKKGKVAEDNKNRTITSRALLGLLQKPRSIQLQHVASHSGSTGTRQIARLLGIAHEKVEPLQPRSDLDRCKSILRWTRPVLDFYVRKQNHPPPNLSAMFEFQNKFLRGRFQTRAYRVPSRLVCPADPKIVSRSTSSYTYLPPVQKTLKDENWILLFESKPFHRQGPGQKSRLVLQGSDVKMIDDQKLREKIQQQKKQVLDRIKKARKQATSKGPQQNQKWLRYLQSIQKHYQNLSDPPGQGK